MRKMLAVLVLLAGCSITKPAFHSKMPPGSVYVDPHYSWVNQCPVKTAFVKPYGVCQSPWRSITIRVINTRYRDVRATVKCTRSDRTKFGEQTRVVRKRDNTSFLVWGLTRTNLDPESVVCRVVKVI